MACTLIRSIINLCYLFSSLNASPVYQQQKIREVKWRDYFATNDESITSRKGREKKKQCEREKITFFPW